MSVDYALLLLISVFHCPVQVQSLHLHFSFASLHNPVLLCSISSLISNNWKLLPWQHLVCTQCSMLLRHKSRRPGWTVFPFCVAIEAFPGNSYCAALSHNCIYFTDDLVCLNLGRSQSTTQSQPLPWHEKHRIERNLYRFEIYCQFLRGEENSPF